MTIVLAGEMFRGSEDQPECSRLQSLLRQPKVFGRCRRGANLDDKDNHVDPYDHKGQYYLSMDLIRLEVEAALWSCLLSEPAESARLPGRSISYLSSLSLYPLDRISRKR